MESPTSKMLCALLVVFYSTGSNSMQPQSSKKLIYDCSSSKWPIIKHKFIAFLYDEINLFNKKSPPFGTAVVLTEIHALTAASVIVEEFIRNSNGTVLRAGGLPFYVADIGQTLFINDVKHHPSYNASLGYPEYDIAVIFLKNAIEMKDLGISAIPLKTTKVNDNSIVIQLGWGWQIPKRPNDEYLHLTLREFRVSSSATNYTFLSNPPYYADQGDHGAPVFIEEGNKFELVGITSMPSTSRPAVFTRVYSLSTFIIDQIRKDTSKLRKKYTAIQWIRNLLNKTILKCSRPAAILE